ncbi:unnamed protein product [Ixodes pacificus]
MAPQFSSVHPPTHISCVKSYPSNVFHSSKYVKRSQLSNASINILTNIPPIEYTLNREIALLYIYSNSNSHTRYTKLLTILVNHTNIYGNDIADHLANTSRDTGTPVTLFPNNTYVN